MYEGQIYKTLEPEDYIITPFYAYKNWAFDEGDIYKVSTDTGSVIQFLEGKYSSTEFDISTELTNSDGTYKRSLYDMISKVYYSNSSNPADNFTDFNYGNTIYDLKTEFIYIGIPNIKFGEEVTANSVSIVGQTYTVTDDGYGNIKSGSEYVGNIFYKTGDIVLTETGSLSYADISSSYFQTLNYKGKTKINEHNISCGITRGELSMTLNRTAYSGSAVGQTVVSGSGLPIDTILDSTDWNPYITSIGLYDDNHNLLVVGKLAKPVMNSRDIDTTFVIKFDT